MMPSHISTALDHYISTMEGWTTPARCKEICELVIETKPDVCVEIGVFAGRSLLAQAFGLRENGKGKVYGIDYWKLDTAIEGENQDNKQWWTEKLDLELMHRLTMQAIWGHHLDSIATIIRAPSQHVYELFPNIDLLNIDGCHSESASCRDVTNYLPRVKHGGYILMDDCDWQSTQKAQSLLESQCTVVKVGEGGHYKHYRKL